MSPKEQKIKELKDKMEQDMRDFNSTHEEVKIIIKATK